MSAGNGAPLQLTRMHRVLIGVVVTGAVTIAGIGFAGSYAAVRELAIKKGFGNFAYVFPIGIDAGICILLALDLLLTWIRIPFPLLRQTAWLLTAATIAFNASVASDPLGMGMHAVIPVLFVVAVEAARHAIGRIADITADKHMEGVRLTRWLLSPVPTFLLWRRMKLWELRSYEQVIKLEQERLVYQARLRSRFGRAWRRKVPVESLMPLKLARYGVPLAQTAPAGLAAADINEPMLFLAGTETGSAPAVLAVASVEHQRSLEAGSPADDITLGHQEQESPGAAEVADDVAVAQPDDSVQEQAQQPALELTADSVSDFASAYADYANQYGAYPTARQFAVFLFDVHGVADPSHGGPIAEMELVPVVRELRRQAESPGEWTIEPPAAGISDVPAADPGGQAVSVSEPSFFGAAPSGPPAPSPTRSTEPVTASSAEVPVAGGQVPQQTTPDAAPRGSRGVYAGGEATARLPEQQPQEQELGPLQQQIVEVAGWLAEAEEAGSKLSGAEVGRRLGVAERTGRRRLADAEKYLSEQRRHQARTRLRSVGDR